MNDLSPVGSRSERREKLPFWGCMDQLTRAACLCAAGAQVLVQSKVPRRMPHASKQQGMLGLLSYSSKDAASSKNCNNATFFHIANGMLTRCIC